jgi:hypothetical protein
MPKKRKLKKAAKTLAKAAVAGGVAGMAGKKIGSMAKQGVRMNYEDEHRTYDYRGTYGNPKKKKTTEKASQTPGEQAGTKVGSMTAKGVGKMSGGMFPFAITNSQSKQEAYDNRITMRTDKAPTKQMAPIDPRTGMPIQPQMTPQPNTVGMPGSMQMPADIGHTLPEHGIQAGGRKMSPYMQKKKTSVAGQDITESGHMDVSYQDGPKEGDLIRGPHLKYDNIGLPQDYDYKIKFEKDTVDQSGPYKIYKTTGIK